MQLPIQACPVHRKPNSGHDNEQGISSSDFLCTLNSQMAGGHFYTVKDDKCKDKVGTNINDATIYYCDTHQKIECTYLGEKQPYYLVKDRSGPGATIPIGYVNSNILSETQTQQT